MPKIGIVYYADDPYKRVFRTVHLQTGDDPATVAADPNWTTIGVDPAREVVLEIVEEGTPINEGTPWTPADQPYPPPAPTPYRCPKSVVDAALALARVGPGDVVIDLGSGVGAWLIAAAMLGARAIGIEQDAGVNALAHDEAAAAGVIIEVREQDYQTADLSEGTVVIVNTGTPWPQSLATRLQARVIAVNCTADDLGLFAPAQIIEVEGHKILFWPTV